jgi:hypothetical protein
MTKKYMYMTCAHTQRCSSQLVNIAFPFKVAKNFGEAMGSSAKRQKGEKKESRGSSVNHSTEDSLLHQRKKEAIGLS